MSRKGECLDNEVAKSFFEILKTELVDIEDYKTKAEAKQSLFEYIEIFYNRRLTILFSLKFQLKMSCSVHKL